MLIKMCVWKCRYCRISFELKETKIEIYGVGFVMKMQVLYMLGDIAAGPAYRFTQWLELVRKRSHKYRSSGFPNRLPRLDAMPSWFVSFCCSFMYFPSVISNWL